MLPHNERTSKDAVPGSRGSSEGIASIFFPLGSSTP